MSQIVDQEKLTLADEELEKGFEEIAANVNQPAEQIRSYYQQNSDKLEIFKHTLLEKDAIKLIIDNSTIENVEPKQEQSDQNKEDQK